MPLHKPEDSLQKSESLRGKVSLYINREKLSESLYIIIIAVTMAAIAVTIFFAQKNHREIVRLSTEQFNQQQLILARSAAAGIKHFMAEIEDEICALSNFPAVQKMETGMLEQMKILFMGIPQETLLRRLDKNGILRFIYPNKGWRKNQIGRDYSHETWFQKARETGKIVISGLIINEMGDWRLRVAKPVYIEVQKGTRIFNGVIISSFDPKKLSKLYISSLVSGKTGYACLLSEDGLFMAHHETEFIAKDAFKLRAERSPDISYDTINNIQRKMMAGKEGIGRYMSGWHRGKMGKIEKLIAYTPVHVFNKIWSVAVCAPVDEVEQITSKAYRNELYLLGFIILILTAADVFFFIAFYRWARSLEQEIKMRKEAQERINHINAVLRAVRNVNQLITKVKDREELLQGACNNLIETRGFHSAWIALTEEDSRFAITAQAGVDAGFAEIVDDLKRGELTPCIQQAIDWPGVVLVRNPADECGNCPLVATYADKARAIGRLEYGGHIYGFLVVTVPVEMVADEEEQSLFGEVADDIAFAMHTIEMEAKKKHAEEELAKHRDHLEELVEKRTSELEAAQEAMVNLVEDIKFSKDELEKNALELEEMNIKLQEATRLKSRFLANMSHELRTPLNSIIGFTGIILQGITGELNNEQKKQLNMVYESAKHLLGLINDILDLSKIEAGKIEIHPAEFKVKELIEMV
ncbi:MAG: GAF domain-containing protein, partial [Deltaproteobacteria bacterium]|nr:GAF domain-containing protein [Deltaproteobacteria bacterium]